MCSAPDSIGGWMKEKYGYQGTNVSGNTMRRAPLPAASAIAARTRSSVPVGVSRSGAICTAATLTIRFSAISSSPSGPPLAATSRLGASQLLESPGMEHDGVVVAVDQREIQHVE